VVRNHEDGTLGGNWRSHPEGSGLERKREGRGGGNAGPERNRESDSAISYDGGAIFGQPQERKPGFAAGSQGPKPVGKVGAKVRRVAHVTTKVARADRSKVLEGRDAATHPKAEEGISERPGSRDFDRSSSPRRWHLQMRRCGADHIPASPRSEERERDRGASARRDRGRDISSAGSVLRHPIREPRGERRRWNRKEPPAPEGQVNHIPVRRFAVVAP